MKASFPPGWRRGKFSQNYLVAYRRVATATASTANSTG